MQINFIDPQRAKRVLAQAYKILSNDKIHPELEYVRFEIKGKQCKIVATDACAMLIANEEVGLDNEGITSTQGIFYIHRDEFKGLMKLAPSGILKSNADNNIEYPDYKKAIPDTLHYQHVVIVKTDELINACEIAVKCAKNGKTFMALHEPSVIVLCENDEFRNKSTITVLDSASDVGYFRVFFDPALMLKLLDVKLKENTEITYNQADQPLMVDHNLLMPIKK